jgi:cytochrome c oxidase subunit IV
MKKLSNKGSFFIFTEVINALKKGKIIGVAIHMVWDRSEESEKV